MKIFFKRFRVILVLIASVFFTVSCGGNSKETNDSAPPESMVEDTSTDFMSNKGIGPVKSVTLPDQVDSELAAKGEEIYAQMCSACHKPLEKYIGPAPKGILQRRSPEWVMNMILNPTEMVEKDPIAKELLIEYMGTPMANQGLNEEQARAILEYFRTLK